MKRLTFALSFDYNGDSIEVTVTSDSEREARGFILRMLSESAQNASARGGGIELVEQKEI